MKLEIPVSAANSWKSMLNLRHANHSGLVFGGLALAIFGARLSASVGAQPSLPQERPLLTVEEAVRWRAC
jgi:hypothetical protein